MNHLSLTPGKAMKKSTFMTNLFIIDLSFSPDGRLIVVNYNSDHAYVFSVGQTAG